MIYDKELYHYLILHFPIAMFIVGYIFDMLSVLFKNDFLSKFSFWNLGIGIITGIFSIITGFITDASSDKTHLVNPLNIWDTHGSHMVVAILLFYIIFIVKFYWGTVINKKILLLLHTFALLFFVHGAHLGAKLAGRFF